MRNLRKFNRKCSFFLQKIWSKKQLWRSLVSIPASLALPSRFVNLNQTKNSFPIIVRLWPFLKRPLVKSDNWLNEWFIGSRCPLYWASKNKQEKVDLNLSKLCFSICRILFTEYKYNSFEFLGKHSLQSDLIISLFPTLMDWYEKKCCIQKYKQIYFSTFCEIVWMKIHIIRWW